MRGDYHFPNSPILIVINGSQNQEPSLAIDISHTNCYMKLKTYSEFTNSINKISLIKGMSSEEIKLRALNREKSFERERE